MLVDRAFYVSKVSIRLEFLLSGFAYESVLILKLIELGSKFYFLSNDIIFNEGYEEKICRCEYVWTSV